MTATLQAKVIFSTPISTSDHEDRVIVEHGDGRWSVGRLYRSTPGTLRSIEATFTLADVREAAIAALQGDDAIKTLMNGQAGKGLAAGAMLLMLAIGISDEQIDASARLSAPAAETGQAA